jgi:hypothetical protein
LQGGLRTKNAVRNERGHAGGEPDSTASKFDKRPWLLSLPQHHYPERPYDDFDIGEQPADRARDPQRVGVIE